MDDVKKLFEYVGIEVIECDSEGIVLKFPNGHKLTIYPENASMNCISGYLSINVEKPEIDFNEIGRKYSSEL